VGALLLDRAGRHEHRHANSEGVMSKLDRSKDAGKGISPRIHDRKWWLPDRPDPWLEAIETVDRRGDKAALIALLKSGEVPTPEQLKHLADLLERHQLTRWQGQQATPSYDVTKDEQQLHRAVKEVRDLVKRRDKSVAEALGALPHEECYRTNSRR
jgi:hypothetical protein